MLSHSVYVGGINNLSDARYAAGMYVDQIGIPVGGERGLSIEKFKEITQWLSGVNIIAQLQDIPDFPLEELELTGWEVSEAPLFDWLKARTDLPIGWRGDLALISTSPQDADFLVIEGGSMGAIPQYLNAFWDVNQDLLDAAVWKHFPDMKIALVGGKEERPGFSNFGNLMDILEALELE